MNTNATEGKTERLSGKVPGEGETVDERDIPLLYS